MSRTVNDMYVLRDKEDAGTYYARHEDTFLAGTFGDAVLYTKSDALLALDPEKELCRQYEAVRLAVIIHSIILKTYK